MTRDDERRDDAPRFGPSGELEKQCSRCLRSRPHSAFGIRRASRDGLSYWCIDCKREAEREYRERRLRPAKLASPDLDGATIHAGHGVRVTRLERWPDHDLYPTAPVAPAPAYRMEPEWLPDAEPPAPAAPAPAAPALPSFPRYTLEEWISLADGPSLLVAESYALLYLVRDGEVQLYLLEPDFPGHGAPVPPVGAQWINVLARFIQPDSPTPRGRAFFQARERGSDR